MPTWQSLGQVNASVVNMFVMPVCGVATFHVAAQVPASTGLVGKFLVNSPWSRWLAFSLDSRVTASAA